jgi:mycothiol synthase
MQLRPVLPADRAELDVLFALASECDGHFPIGEHKYLDLMAGQGPTAGLVASADGAIVAYVAVTPPRDDRIAALELAVHPLHRSHEVIGQLIRDGVDVARDTGAGAVRVWAFQPNMVEEYIGAGFRSERELRQLRVALPLTDGAQLPAAMREARFRPGTDDEAWLEVNNAAFAGHPENGSWTHEILADRMAQPWFDPEGFVTVWQGDDDLAGFCWTKPHDSLGEIYVIAVSPDHQGKGLGRFLVVRGLEVIEHHHGFSTGMLYMDADNAPAAALYRSLGFRLHHVDRSLLLPLQDT